MARSLHLSRLFMTRNTAIRPRLKTSTRSFGSTVKVLSPTLRAWGRSFVSRGGAGLRGEGRAAAHVHRFGAAQSGHLVPEPELFFKRRNQGVEQGRKLEQQAVFGKTASNFELGESLAARPQRDRGAPACARIPQAWPLPGVERRSSAVRPRQDPARRSVKV